MATDVPQRKLRNRTAELLRRVEAGERLRITVHGHPVAELGPVDTRATFVSTERLTRELTGLLAPGDDFSSDARDDTTGIRDPFA